jgi:hypothetical protein
MEFRGLRTKDDIRRLLLLIDLQEYPLGSGCAWPQFFVQKAWGLGFRMEDQAELLVDALQACLPGGSLECGVSARQLFLSIRRFLIDYADIECRGKTLPTDLWSTAVDYALIQDAAEIAAEDKLRKRGRVRL